MATSCKRQTWVPEISISRINIKHYEMINECMLSNSGSGNRTDGYREELWRPLKTFMKIQTAARHSCAQWITTMFWDKRRYVRMPDHQTVGRSDFPNLRLSNLSSGKRITVFWTQDPYVSRNIRDLQFIVHCKITLESTSKLDSEALCKLGLREPGEKFWVCCNIYFCKKTSIQLLVL